MRGVGKWADEAYVLYDESEHWAPTTKQIGLFIVSAKRDT